jgi:hypothetical protein
MMKGSRQTISFLVVFLLSGVPVITAAEEPFGLILRKGLIVWKSTLQQARNFIEEDIHPDTSRPRSFACEQTDSPGVLRCSLACCVDFGEGETLRFATLYFYKDQFYHYNIAFPLALYRKIADATKKKYGKPTKSEEGTMTNLRGDRFDNLVEQWRQENTLIVLSSRGGGGKIFLSYLDVYYTSIYRQILENQPKPKLPY